ncbi:hypothetical protein CO609_08925 [Lysobacteraceae bacterium NML91-0268]|nr:hypothetical protein CO609_08925 [Xanthomonadaceae bacterium NML91-0268]
MCLGGQQYHGLMYGHAGDGERFGTPVPAPAIRFFTPVTDNGEAPFQLLQIALDSPQADVMPFAFQMAFQFATGSSTRRAWQACQKQ